MTIRSVLFPTLFLVVLFTASLLWAGCGPRKQSDNIPAQPYATVLESPGSEQGDILGRIRFPSEYNQRSVSFLLDGKTFVTQPDGRFRISRVPVGSHLMRVYVRGFQRVDRTFRVTTDQEMDLGPVQVDLARGRLLGRLTHPDGTSAGGVNIKLSPLSGVAATDKDGIFQFLGISSGAHTLIVDDPRYIRDAREVYLEVDQQLNLGNIQIFRRVVQENRTASRIR